MIPETSFYGGCRVLTGSTITRGLLLRTRTLVAPTGAGFAFITLPDATGLQLGGPQAIVINLTASNFLVKDNAGTTIATIPTQKKAVLFLSANANAAGHWRVIMPNPRATAHTTRTLPATAPTPLPTEQVLYWADSLASQTDGNYGFNPIDPGTTYPSHYSDVSDPTYVTYYYDVASHFMIPHTSGFRPAQIMFKNSGSDTLHIELKWNPGSDLASGRPRASMWVTIGDDGEFDDAQGQWRFLSVGRNFSPAGNGSYIDYFQPGHSEHDAQSNFGDFTPNVELEIHMDISPTSCTVAVIGHGTQTLALPSGYASYSELSGRDGMIQLFASHNTGVKMRNISIYKTSPVAYPIPLAPINCRTSKFRLTECSDATSHLYSDSDLATYVGKVIRINEEAGNWTVENWNEAALTDPAAVTIAKNKKKKKLVFDDCTAAGAVEKIVVCMTDELLIGPKLTSQPKVARPTDSCEITGLLFYKVLAETKGSEEATLYQLFAAAAGTMNFTFTSETSTHLRRYFPILNGKTVHWKSGNADTATSNAQQLDMVLGDMVQIGFKLATSGDPGDLVLAYAHDAARTASTLLYTPSAPDADGGTIIRSAGPEATYITYSGYYMIYADMGVPWKIVPPKGVTVFPPTGSGRRRVYIDISGIAEGHVPLKGKFVWTASAFGDIRQRTRDMYFTRLDATIPTGDPEFPPRGFDFSHFTSLAHLYFVFNGGFEDWYDSQVTELLNREWLVVAFPDNNPTGVTVTSGPKWWAWGTGDSVGGGIHMPFVDDIGTISDISAEGPSWLNLRIYIDESDGGWWVEFTLNQDTLVSLDGKIRVYFRTSDRTIAFIEARIWIGVNSESQPW